jgi:hypothetical protein
MPVEPGVVAQELDAGLLIRVARALGQHPDPPPDLDGSRVRDPGDREAASGRREDRRQDPDGRRLAGAVGSEQADHLAVARREGQLPDCDDGSVGLREGVGLDGHRELPESPSRC